MTDPKQFADKQFELAAELAHYVLDHPWVDDLLPEKSHICFEIEGETEFNRYSKEVAQRQGRQEGVTIVVVRIKSLAPPRGSRLIDPIIVPTSAVA